MNTTRKKFSSDLTDTEWKAIEHFFKNSRLRKWHKRELLNGVFYVLKNGIKWRELPDCFPPWATVYTFYIRARNSGLWEVDIIERPKGKKWEILPERWRVERTFAWPGNYRRLSKDYEKNSCFCNGFCLFGKYSYSAKENYKILMTTTSENCCMISSR